MQTAAALKGLETRYLALAGDGDAGQGGGKDDPEGEVIS
jgi:hypothetical protein